MMHKLEEGLLGADLVTATKEILANARAASDPAGLTHRPRVCDTGHI